MSEDKNNVEEKIVIEPEQENALLNIMIEAKEQADAKQEVVGDVTFEPEVIESEVIDMDEKTEIDNNDDIFITENDKFSINIVYYLDGKTPIIEGVSNEYIPDGKKLHSFEMKFKYPSQRDAEYIMAARPIKSVEDASVMDFIEIENSRIVRLMRGWSMSRPMSDIASVHPDIIKAIRYKVSEVIGGTGIF